MLHGPSIVRTINRFDRWMDNIGNSDPNQQNEVNNIINEVGLQEKEKDLNTILKFLPVWEVRENKKHDNNNNCVVCLCEFQIGDIISIIGDAHVRCGELGVVVEGENGAGLPRWTIDRDIITKTYRWRSGAEGG